MKTEIINQQSLKRINLKKLNSYLKIISKLLGLSSSRISLVLCDNKFIKDLNKKYFKKDVNTDVIAFPLRDDFEKDFLGEVVVSVEQAVKVSQKYGNSWQKEIVLYIVHGVLHLLGYEDTTIKKRKVMETKQDEIMRILFYEEPTV